MDGKDANRFMMAGKPDLMGGLAPGAGLLPAQRPPREGTLARGAAALVFGLSAMAAAAAVLVSPRLVDTVEHAARARPLTTARPAPEAAVQRSPVVASVPPPSVAASRPAPEPSASRSLIAEGPAPEPAAAPDGATAPVLTAPEVAEAPRALPVPDAPAAADPVAAPDPASPDLVPAAASNPLPLPPVAMPNPRVELGAAPALPESPQPILEPSVPEQPSAAVEPAALPLEREQTTGATAPTRQPVGTAVTGPAGGTEPPEATPAPEPVPMVPSATAGLVVPEPPVALPRQTIASQPPGLLLVARPGDTLQRLYKSVYTGVRPPPFQDIVDANPSPVRPGVVLVFPTPPDGWRRP